MKSAPSSKDGRSACSSASEKKRSSRRRTGSGGPSVHVSRWRAAGGRSATREGVAAPPASARSSRRGDASGTGNEGGERRERPERGGAATLGGWTVNEIPSTPWVHHIRRIGYVRLGRAAPFLSLRSSAGLSPSAPVLDCRLPLDDALSSAAGGRRTRGTEDCWCLWPAGLGSRPLRWELPRQQRGGREASKTGPWRRNSAAGRRPPRILLASWAATAQRASHGDLWSSGARSTAWRARRAGADDVLVDDRRRSPLGLPALPSLLPGQAPVSRLDPPRPLPGHQHPARGDPEPHLVTRPPRRRTRSARGGGILRSTFMAARYML
ncbi:hypothetical protein GQ55_3G094900 [Panicum hallii var. hallii]|uniref:Uncharacterized protein n=1 Tax=Panicum hallii var. hallii TaxID=1504633 RepID=A0A2T7E7H8_9POAL|nr:hypothetical protein GQ55_3G094900 [Panicum hallii var. hallii]